MAYIIPWVLINNIINISTPYIRKYLENICKNAIKINHTLYADDLLYFSANIFIASSLNKLTGLSLGIFYHSPLTSLTLTISIIFLVIFLIT
ncbi:hypothetical protein PIROE2DRAFT_13371 [Piromyces sp. E2]|nr:hypothetical protein PIROE2DRAFT_13371 [Piromyces sp. E2]|eukprot:OUM60781.1 hypothetical protein PIROE2DRAFT_13371 [Piromyces sp. E2]